MRSIVLRIAQMPFMFENLEVYKKAIDIADELSTLTESFPKGSYYLTDQLNRAALSIATIMPRAMANTTRRTGLNTTGFRAVPISSVFRY